MTSSLYERFGDRLAGVDRVKIFDWVFGIVHGLGFPVDTSLLAMAIHDKMVLQCPASKMTKARYFTLVLACVWIAVKFEHEEAGRGGWPYVHTHILCHCPEESPRPRSSRGWFGTWERAVLRYCGLTVPLSMLITRRVPPEHVQSPRVVATCALAVRSLPVYEMNLTEVAWSCVRVALGQMEADCVLDETINLLVCTCIARYAPSGDVRV